MTRRSHLWIHIASFQAVALWINQIEIRNRTSVKCYRDMYDPLALVVPAASKKLQPEVDWQANTLL